MHIQDLQQGWTVSAAKNDTPLGDRSVPATVPGCVHTDLLAAGLIDDPYIEQNDLALSWIGRNDWVYTCRFRADAALLKQQRVDLACDGLDTLATVELNGTKIGESQNMHVRQRFDARDALREGDNELRITFGAPIPFVEEMDAKFPGRPQCGAGSNPQLPHQMMRKMACNFGWDWGPALTTCGIWLPIRLEAWTGGRLAAVRPHVMEAGKKRAIVDVVVEWEGDPKPIEAELLDPAGQRVALQIIDGKTSTSLKVADPKLWWPVGYGDQPLYELKLHDGDTVLWSHRIGLRTVTLNTDPDPDPADVKVEGIGRGTAMALQVNGKRVFCKGANWIPDDCFVTRVTPERYRERITQALGANMNMLRVWGGGLFETDAFYDICDELGMLVWQDCLCACAAYPEEEPFWSWFEEETIDNVNRLCRHPSLALWNGCNENIWGTFDWAEPWQSIRKDGKLSWGINFYLKMFPEIIGKLDPSRPYWAASPYSGSMDIHPNANEHGNRHVWDVWNGQGEYRNYLAHFPRFASEFGYHGPPTWSTLARSIPEDARQYDHPTMVHHNKCGNGGQFQLHRLMGVQFEQPEDFDDWFYLAHVMQARALSMGVEWFRALSPWCSGSLYWQLNDCWPVTSWSAIDGDGKLKPLWYATRRFYAPRLVTLKPRKVTPIGTKIGELAAYLHNDSDERWTDTLTLYRFHFSGEMLDQVEHKIDVEPRGLARIDVPDEWHDREDALLLAEVGDLRGWWFFAPDRELVYPPADFHVELKRAGDVHKLKITAKSLLREVCLFADRLDPDATVNEQCVTLLPGESFVFEITSTKKLDLRDLTTPPVLQSVNRFGAAQSLTVV